MAYTLYCSVDPDQTAPLRAVWSGSALFVICHFVRNFGVRKFRTFIVPVFLFREGTILEGVNKFAEKQTENQKNCLHYTKKTESRLGVCILKQHL